MLKLQFRKQLLASVAALSIGAFGMSAYAQSASDTAAPGAAPATGQMRHAPTPEQRAKFAADMAKREAKLHDALKLTPNQEGAWTTFVAQIKAQLPEGGMQRPNKDDWKNLTTPQRLQKQSERMAKMQERMTARAASINTFYAQLSPEQQKTFDKHFAQMHRRGHHGPNGGKMSKQNNGTPIDSGA
ncbi:Spy/CpxP family protein refolding chaperone [Glaciimonas soli]|uniref:LTXXQ motif family protein n=1 Tax=Glaciimonas soli TaxID=2590999 RepID=A0A843YV42_9BURK|nr:Spy/CpxP family protein refolding chaperone [Glaciimonas soli]MQR01171.1 hypothetical protein [Glaciimonas soli]